MMVESGGMLGYLCLFTFRRVIKAWCVETLVMFRSINFVPIEMMHYDYKPDTFQSDQRILCM